MNIDRWCIGYRRNPHVPDSGLILTNIAGRRGIRLCKACWQVWNAEDAEGVDW